jgi:hypothetical protein
MSETAAPAAPVENPVSQPDSGSIGDDIARAFDEAVANAPAGRGEDGKFVSQRPAEPEKPSADAPPPKPDDKPVEEKPEAKTETTAEKPLDPPAGLSQAARERWAEIPRELQETILEQHGASERTLAEKDKEVAPLRDMQKVFEEHAARLAARGLTPTEVTRNLLTLHAEMERRPADVLQALARQYGVDLSRAPQQQQAAANPELAALRDQVTRLERALTEGQQQTQQTQAQQIEAQIAAFAKDHPHFTAVRPVMGALISSGAAKDMQDAYDQACHANPSIRAQLAADTSRAEAIRRDREAREASARAVSISGTPPTPASKSVPDTLRGTIEAAFEGRL